MRQEANYICRNLKLCKRDRNRTTWYDGDKKKGTYKTVNNDKAQWRTGRRVFFPGADGVGRGLHGCIWMGIRAVTTKCRLSNMEIMPSANIISKLLEQQTMAVGQPANGREMNGKVTGGKCCCWKCFVYFLRYLLYFSSLVLLGV